MVSDYETTAVKLFLRGKLSTYTNPEIKHSILNARKFNFTGDMEHLISVAAQRDGGNSPSTPAFEICVTLLFNITWMQSQF